MLLVGSRAFGQAVMEADICLYGGTSAGVIGAYTAQKLGKKAILIEPGRHLGGMSSGGLGYTDIGNKYAITGLARDFYRRIGRHYGKFEQWTFEPHVAEEVFQQYVKQGGFQVVYEYRVKEVRKQNGRITEVVLESAATPARADRVVRAAMFIDCGYEGDLMAKAGVSYAVGREDNADYQETIDGVQLMDGHQMPDGIDPYKTPGDPNSGLLWGISQAKLAPNGTGDRSVQAYNYRICLSTDPKNQVPITRPPGYDSTHYELLLRLFAANPAKRKLNDYFIISRMPNNKTDINNRGGFSSDMIGMNHGYPDGTYAQRASIIEDHERYTKGLLYFYGHDPRVPQALRDEMLTYGYPRDEYTDNGHWSPQLYVREARRLVGAYVMRQANCEGREVVRDGIGMAAYTMDSHNCQRLVVNGHVKNEGNVEIGGFGPYPIGYGALTPKAAECTNLLVPVCLSATHIAYGSIRMEPVFMVLAQSSAVAAVQAIQAKKGVQQVDVAAVQASLKNNPLADGRPGDILVDNEDATATRTGTWESVKRGGYGPSFLKAAAGEEASLRFTPAVPKQQAYTAYLYMPKVTDAANSFRVTVYDGKTKKDITVKPAEVIVEGQTSGEWVSLGKYTLPKGNKGYVEVSTPRAGTGSVVADAVLWVPDGQAE
ncbi:FAD-dependent oxidoreductase [Fulvivirgaceae bacterium PWU37]|uniref:FAD-dependent oxidoreductase n=2 Tax=Dawidia soli TaxID=2782352 RepID=A0AAP2GJ99_9BACT|nr:FAD-dependent oxidoreductase [Dawidia soli]MBT1689181.1 FAD-dependent oxidoreductase [Dawidia soli]